jgi:hypothetical protein
MIKKHSKTAYFILVLLILLVIAIIGGLAMVLFNSDIPNPNHLSSRAMHANRIEHDLAATKKVIDMHARETPSQPKEHHIHTTMITPAVCDGYGRQTQSRNAYKHPASYNAIVHPNHVNFTIYSNRKTTSK